VIVDAFDGRVLFATGDSFKVFTEADLDHDIKSDQVGPFGDVHGLLVVIANLADEGVDFGLGTRLICCHSLD
jgi:hypothetical protein